MPQTKRTQPLQKTVKPQASGTQASHRREPKVSDTLRVKKDVTATSVETKKSVQATVVGVDGKATGRISLPGELFAAKINKQLLAQAVRVYLANQRVGNASTKTRGQVRGSTRKIYRQKGTGRARHGAIRAPIFVGGGIVFGPKPRDYHLELPKKMKRAALACALSSQFHDGNIVLVDGLESLPPKTKDMDKTLSTVGAMNHTLLVTAPNASSVVRAARNLPNVDTLPARELYAYAVISHQKVVVMKDAVSVLKDTFVRT